LGPGWEKLLGTNTLAYSEHYLPVLKFSEGNFNDDVFQEDADDNVSGNDCKKNPAEIFIAWSQRVQLSLSVIGTDWCQNGETQHNDSQRIDTA
jgi:hypothetical protein